MWGTSGQLYCPRRGVSEPTEEHGYLCGPQLGLYSLGLPREIGQARVQLEFIAVQAELGVIAREIRV